MYQNFHKGFDLTLIYINVGLILPSKDSWYIPGPCAGSEVLVENSENSGEKEAFFVKLEWVWVKINYKGFLWRMEFWVIG